MTWTKPSWYVTTDEFANLVIDALDEQGYFKKGELAHPEDIVVAFTNIAESIAKGIGFAGRKIYEQRNSL